MIDAKDARKITATSNAAFQKHLEEIEKGVRNRASDGYDLFIYSTADEDVLRPLTDTLTIHGYKVKKAHSTGIEIGW